MHLEFFLPLDPLYAALHFMVLFDIVVGHLFLITDLAYQLYYIQNTPGVYLHTGSV